MKYLLIPAFILLLFSCKDKQTLPDKQKELETGKLDSKYVYTVDEVGWTTHIPKGWDVETREQMEKKMKKGKDIMENSLNTEIDISGLQQLLNLKKNISNFFLSSMEKLDSSMAKDFKKYNNDVYEILKEGYRSKKIEFSYEQGVVAIDGLEFFFFKAAIYKDPARKNVLMRQDMYSRLINGYDLSMAMVYTEEISKQELEKMVFGSSFSKRD